MGENNLIETGDFFDDVELLGNSGVISEVRVEMIVLDDEGIVINLDFEDRLMELVLKYHPNYSDEYFSNIQHKMYLRLIDGQKIVHHENISKNLLIDLINDGFISNGFIRERKYARINLGYHDEYALDKYQVENNSFEPIVQTDDEYLTSDELITRLVDCGLIKEVAPNLFKNIYKIKPKDD